MVTSSFSHISQGSSTFRCQSHMGSLVTHVTHSSGHTFHSGFTSFFHSHTHIHFHTFTFTHNFFPPLFCHSHTLGFHCGVSAPPQFPHTRFPFPFVGPLVLYSTPIGHSFSQPFPISGPPTISISRSNFIPRPFPVITPTLVQGSTLNYVLSRQRSIFRPTTQKQRSIHTSSTSCRGTTNAYSGLHRLRVDSRLALSEFHHVRGCANKPILGPQPIHD